MLRLRTQCNKQVLGCNQELPTFALIRSTQGLVRRPAAIAAMVVETKTPVAVRPSWWMGSADRLAYQLAALHHCRSLRRRRGTRMTLVAVTRYLAPLLLNRRKTCAILGADSDRSVTMSRYEIAFSGQVLPGAELALVQANLAKLFQADAQRIALLFSGRRIVIKSNLDAAGAEKYRATLERAGARVEVVALDGEDLIEEIELAPPPPASAAPQAPAVPVATAQPSAGARLKVAPRDEYMAAFAEVDAPDFGIAPVGVDLQDARPAAQAPAVDFSQFSLAPVGSDMGEVKAKPAGPPPDTSHLKLQ